MATVSIPYSCISMNISTCFMKLKHSETYTKVSAKKGSKMEYFSSNITTLQSFSLSCSLYDCKCLFFLFVSNYFNAFFLLMYVVEIVHYTVQDSILVRCMVAFDILLLSFLYNFNIYLWSFCEKRHAYRRINTYF